MSEQISNALVQRIVSGELHAGERLIETRIAAEFGTSQAPVREALRDVEGLGLIESRPRRGRTVVPFAEQTIREAYVVRAALEEMATRLVMASSSVSFDQLADAVNLMFRCAGDNDVDGIARASAAFHRHVIEASRNSLLQRAWEALQIEARTMVALLTVEPDLEGVADEHRELLDVMRTGDVEAACEHARDHQLIYADARHNAHTAGRLPG